MEGKSIEKLVPVRVTESGKAPIALVRTELLCSVNVFVQNNNFFETTPPPPLPLSQSLDDRSPLPPPLSRVKFKVKVLALRYE